eukprot:Nk52_evm36s2340 gene=Nk52_evmTU36s2340
MVAMIINLLLLLLLLPSPPVSATPLSSLPFLLAHIHTLLEQPQPDGEAGAVLVIQTQQDCVVEDLCAKGSEKLFAVGDTEKKKLWRYVIPVREIYCPQGGGDAKFIFDLSNCFDATKEDKVLPSFDFDVINAITGESRYAEKDLPTWEKEQSSNYVRLEKGFDLGASRVFKEAGRSDVIEVRVDKENKICISWLEKQIKNKKICQGESVSRVFYDDKADPGGAVTLRIPKKLFYCYVTSSSPPPPPGEAVLDFSRCPLNVRTVLSEGEEEKGLVRIIQSPVQVKSEPESGVVSLKHIADFARPDDVLIVQVEMAKQQDEMVVDEGLRCLLGGERVMEWFKCNGKSVVDVKEKKSGLMQVTVRKKDYYCSSSSSDSQVWFDWIPVLSRPRQCWDARKGSYRGQTVTLQVEASLSPFLKGDGDDKGNDVILVEYNHSKCDDEAKDMIKFHPQEGCEDDQWTPKTANPVFYDDKCIDKHILTRPPDCDVSMLVTDASHLNSQTADAQPNILINNVRVSTYKQAQSTDDVILSASEINARDLYLPLSDRLMCLLDYSNSDASLNPSKDQEEGEEEEGGRRGRLNTPPRVHDWRDCVDYERHREQYEYMLIKKREIRLVCSDGKTLVQDLKQCPPLLDFNGKGFFWSYF